MNPQDTYNDILNKTTKRLITIQIMIIWMVMRSFVVLERMHR